jgi:hypothetical protein
MTDDYPWEPPLAGSEAEHLVGALDRLRWTFRWKAVDGRVGEDPPAGWRPESGRSAS